jgi:spore germination cell wall hydrolase CwlJ-like protein
MAASAGVAAPESGRGAVAHQPRPVAANPAPSQLDRARAKAVLAARPSLSSLVYQRSQNAGAANAEIECIAKVVLHEASNQSLRAQLAVAEVVVNRTRSSDFPASACAVANQRGQFFPVSRYHAPKDTARWRTAVAIARIAQAGESPRVAPGALFFHAAYTRPAWSHTRPLVTEVGGQYFYR